VITKYAINTVKIAHLSTNRKTIQVHHTVCIEAGFTKFTRTQLHVVISPFVNRQHDGVEVT